VGFKGPTDVGGDLNNEDEKRDGRIETLDCATSGPSETVSLMDKCCKSKSCKEQDARSHCFDGTALTDCGFYGAHSCGDLNNDEMRDGRIETPDCAATSGPSLWLND